MKAILLGVVSCLFFSSAGALGQCQTCPDGNNLEAMGSCPRPVDTSGNPLYQILNGIFQSKLDSTITLSDNSGASSTVQVTEGVFWTNISTATHISLLNYSSPGTPIYSCVEGGP